MKGYIKKGLEQGISYEAYRELVKRLAETHSTTGLEKTEDLINYTKMNDKRMNRWDKTLKVSDDAKAKIQSVNAPITMLVISESWCGDAAHVLPVLNKIAQLNTHIEFKVVLRDEHPELMDAFLTNGSRSVPKVLLVDNDSGEVVNTFGPRPSEATHFVKRFKALHGVLTPDFKEDLQHWYNQNKGQNVIEDMTAIFCQLETSFCQ
ncbi:thioredoxin family protein [Changchengzhania lutea]|uniref:thioredoxin family protein n=1 Tax=Changchengzhania lutea TaxID=2049305 RepID=UPI00115E3010|nr:thioredoxin family protein [Changchengzhania lutea]